MKYLILAIVAIALCHKAQAQIIRTLGYNTTNGKVVANIGTNVLTFTNAIEVSGISINANGLFYGAAGIDFDSSKLFGNGAVELFNWNDDTRVSFALPIEFSNTTNAATTRANLGYSTNLNTLWTATNASNARSAVGLGATNDVVFQSVQAGTSDPFTALDNLGLSIESTNTNTGASAITFVGDGASRMATNTRTNLGLPLAALTNTSNVTMMRALSGSTNTNHPFSGSISVTGTNNTNTLVFSNGILQSVQ